MREMQIVDNFFILSNFKSQNERKNRKLQSNYNLKRGFSTQFLPLFLPLWSGKR